MSRFRRLSLGVIDQAMSSASNVLATLLAARYLTRADFGAYSLTLLTYILAVGLVRALCGEALLVRPGETEDESRTNIRAATSSALFVGLFISALLLVASGFTSHPLRPCLQVFSVLLPLLLVQDTFRYAAFANNRPKAAAISDAVWVVTQLGSFAALVALGHPTAVTVLMTWAGAGAAAAVVIAILSPVAPDLRQGMGWVWGNRDLSVRYGLEFFSSVGAAQVGSFILAAVAGIKEVGGIRGAQTLFGPLNVLFVGAYIALVPEGRRMADESPRSLVRLSAVSSVVFGASAAGLTGVLLLLGPAQGRAVLGTTWDAAHPILLPVGLAAMAGGVMAGPLTGLRSLADAKRLLRVRLATMPTTLMLPAIGAWANDAEGLAWGIVAATWINVVVYWRAFLRSATAPVTTAPEPEVLTVADPPVPS